MHVSPRGVSATRAGIVGRGQGQRLHVHGRRIEGGPFAIQAEDALAALALAGTLVVEGSDALRA